MIPADGERAEAGGRWLAPALLLLVGLASFGLAGYVFLYKKPRLGEDPCLSNLKQIGVALRLYEDSFREFPSGLEDLLRNGDIGEDALHCPASGERYTWVLPANYEKFPSGMWVLLSGRKGAHRNGRCCLRADGSATIQDEALFKTILDHQRSLDESKTP